MPALLPNGLLWAAFLTVLVPTTRLSNVQRFDSLRLGAMATSDLAAPLSIALGARSYPIHFGEWNARASGETLRGLALVVSNDVVGDLYGAKLAQALQGCHARVERLELPDGETFKNWESVQLILDRLLAMGADRKATIYALGGGVVGDLAGFAAAIFMRGIDFVQVPTTLLAQVDSSVGGKTGFNHALGKNLIGAFHQPKAVWMDLTTLRTLPVREYRAGLAEMVKYGPIADGVFFDWLEAHATQLIARDEAVLAVAVRRSCEIKAAVVAADEHEGGVRAALNLGHTFGHALETGLGYGTLLHGEAVAMGMVMAAEASVAALGCDPAVLTRLKALLSALGLVVKAPYLAPDRFMSLMQADKKAQAGSIRYVLLEGMGRPVLAELPLEVALAAIAANSEAA